MRALSLLFGVALLFAACSNNTSVKGLNPTSPTSPITSSAFAGTWVGTASDSTGGLMGAGVGSTTLTLTLTQNGNQVSGTISGAGFTIPTGQPVPTFTGAVSGNTITFTMTAPAGTIPSNGAAACSSTANGTMTLTGTGQAGSTMSGTFSGTNSCVGAFANGQITLTKQ